MTDKKADAYSDGVADFKKGFQSKDASEYWASYAQYYYEGYNAAKKASARGTVSRIEKFMLENGIDRIGPIAVGER